MERKEYRAYIIAIVIAIFIAGSAFFYKKILWQAPILPPVVPVLGVPGSTHSHASLLVIVGASAVDFCKPQYMLRSQYVHFKDNNCLVLHKQATGVTLQTFFKTIGVELTNACLAITPTDRHCANAENKLHAVINGADVPIKDLAHYELHNNDHILINYGPEEGTLLRFKYNQVPNVPVGVNEPLAGPQL